VYATTVKVEVDWYLVDVGCKLALHVVGRAVVEMLRRKLLVLYGLILPPT